MTRTFPTALLVAAGLLAAAPASQAADGKEITVYKSPTCGCCTVWAEALEAAGYTIETRHVEDLSPVKSQAGVPEELHACHTAMVDGYVVEGHVPLQALDKLLTERPEVRGISTPGMPQGSLGMGYDETARYTVYSFTDEAGAAPRPFYEAGQ